MASPFSVFRRNQKVAMVVLGVVVILGFVVVPAMLQLQENAGSSASNPVVVKWNGGQLTEQEMMSKRHTRGSLLRFLQQLQQDALKKDPEAKINNAVGIPNSDHPSSIVQTMLLAQKARDMGIVVSDDAISDYLSGVTDGVLTPAELVSAKREALGTKWTEEMLFNALREELLAQKLRQMMFTATTVTTPAAAWEYHNRMERRVTAEFVPFAVEDFVKDVTTKPTNREIEELYEKYKADYPMPENPEPGFKQRPQADFQYFVADYTKYLQEEKAKVTQAQIEKYYEDNKNSFRIDEPADDLNVGDPDDPRSAEPKPPVPPTEEAADEGATEETTPPTEGEATLPPKEADATLPPKEDEQESGEPGVQGETGDAGDAAPADPAATDKPEVELPPIDKPATDDPPAESEEPSTTDDDLTVPPASTPKYKPLSEVEEEIRAALASEPAQKRLTEAMSAASGELKKYRDEVVFHDTDPDNTPDPGPFDYKAAAKKLGLGSGDTGLIDALDLYEDKDLELGQSYRLEEDMRGGRPQEIPFGAVAFDEGKSLYYPFETQLRGREKVFLSWRVDKKDARIPPLSEIREEVEAAWKLQEARKLAQAAADKFAAELDAKKPLQEQAGKEHKVLTPPPFTYYQPLSMWMFRLRGQQPEWEEIQGIEDTSSDAIKKRVLAMPVGGVEVVENAAKSKFYVVRLASDEGEADSRKNFMQSIVDSQLDGPPPELRYVGYNDQLSLFQDWSEQVDKEFGLEWLDKEYLERSARNE